MSLYNSINTPSSTTSTTNMYNKHRFHVPVHKQGRRPKLFPRRVHRALQGIDRFVLTFDFHPPVVQPLVFLLRGKHRKVVVGAATATGPPTGPTATATATKSKNRLVLIILVVVFPPQIKKIQVRIHATVKVKRACLFTMFPVVLEGTQRVHEYHQHVS